MAVVANGTPNMTTIVSAGSCRISTGTYPSSYGYFGAIDTTTGTPAGEPVTHATANGSNPRIDTVVAYVDTTLTPSTSPANNPGMLKLMAVAGTPNASPSAPSGATIQAAVGAANPYIKLANVLVGTSVTTITNANITDVRTFLTTGSITNGSVTASKIDLTTFSASASSSIFTASTSASASLGSMSVNVVAGRKYLITLTVKQSNATSTAEIWQFDIRVGGVPVGNGARANGGYGQVSSNAVSIYTAASTASITIDAYLSIISGSGAINYEGVQLTITQIIN